MKTKLLFFATIFLLFCFCAKAQQMIIDPKGDTFYIPQMLLSDSLFQAGDIKEALDAYRKDYVKDPAFVVCYNFACALAMDRQPDSAFKYLFEAIKYDTNVLPLTDPNLLVLRSDKRWKDFEDRVVTEVLAKFPNAISDLPLAEKLWEMMALDQEYYYEINIVEKKIGMNSPVELALWDMKEKINARNSDELDSIVSVKGWPKISVVGHYASVSAFLIVQHSTTERQKKYLPAIKELCKENEADWQDYALMYDRVQVSENKLQLYGSQVKYNEQTKQNEFFPIDDEKNVNKRRAEMNMQPIEVYAQQFGINYVPK